MFYQFSFKMMSLSFLKALLELDRQHMWLKYVDDNGYLACIINSIQTNNSLLEECFHSETSDRKVIFVYETKMVFFHFKRHYFMQLIIFFVLNIKVVFNFNLKKFTRC